jgi:predicted phage terminase large subunit-like protein
MGKSRSLINFASWVLGKNVEERIITCSYNDELARDFSKYTRNTIQEKKERPHEVIYSDIFPETKIKLGDASYKQWALENQFFTYKGAGIGGAVTGKGATILIGDDLVKDAATAFNELSLDSIWLWYSGTFLSRAEEGALQILCMTRWSKLDPIGRILEGTTASDWYILNMEAYDDQTDTMLCPELLSKESYLSLKANMDPLIFEANYHNTLIDIKGRLYTYLKEYQTIPTPVERTIAYIDTADEGKDYLSCIIADIHKGQAYVKDIYYTKAAMEITEAKVAELLFTYKVNMAFIESNNGGRGFARNVERLLWENHKSRFTKVEWFHQSMNKMARILSNATNVMNNTFFPLNWQTIYKDAYLSMIAYQRETKNKNDDLQDALTGIQEKMNANGKSGMLDKRSLGL